MPTTTPFEIWAYRGAIALLLTVIGWWIIRYINGQDKINKQLFELIQANKEALIAIAADLKNGKEICQLKHDGIEEQLASIDHKKK